MNSIKVIIDNSHHPSRSFLAEHGLSVFINFNDHNILFDTGASKNFLVNAYKLHINLESIDYLFLSHAHVDHTGGVNAFISCNTKAPIFLSRNILFHQFYSYKNGIRRDISHDNNIFTNYPNRFNFINEDSNPLPDVYLFSRVISTHPLPHANTTLYKCFKEKEVPDDFDHELFLVLDTGKGLILLSACSHKGILNILNTVKERFKNKKILCVIGGMHLPDSDEINHFETPEEIISIATYIQKEHLDTVFYIGHCIGIKVFDLLKSILKERIIKIYSGFEISI